MPINTYLYGKTALELKLPVTLLLDDIYGFKICFNRHEYIFRGGYTPYNDHASASIANDKYCTNQLLRRYGFTVPKAICISRDMYLKNEWDVADLRFPLVAKPTRDTLGGEGVVCNIKNMTVLKTYFDEHFNKYNMISLEEFVAGLSAFRVLIFYNKVIGIVKRYPAMVIGDGQSTILELIERENLQRQKLKESVNVSDIVVDQEFNIRLEELNLTLKSIPNKNQQIVLCYNCNSSRGGTMESLDIKLCQYNQSMLLKAAKCLNLNLVGFDILCEDINKPFNNSRAYIIEANSFPDISLHEQPIKGVPNRVSKTILKKIVYKHPFIYFLHRFKHFFKTY